MDLQPTAVRTDPVHAAQALAHLIQQTPTYRAFLQALHAVNDDLTIQTLSSQLRGHRTAVQWGRDPEGLHAAEVMRLELELGDLPLAQEYHRLERDVSQLLRAVDEIVSQEAGIDFAVNAQRTVCGCGG